MDGTAAFHLKFVGTEGRGKFSSPLLFKEGLGVVKGNCVTPNLDSDKNHHQTIVQLYMDIQREMSMPVTGFL